MADVIDRESVSQAVEAAADLAFPGGYIGVSAKDLARYNSWESASEGLSLDETDAEIIHIYAALAVLARSAKAPETTPGARWLREAGAAVAARERVLYPSTAFPYDSESFPHQQALEGIVRVFESSDRSAVGLLRSLQNDSIRHEWTVKAGKRLFLELTGRLHSSVRAAVCHQRVFGRAENRDFWLDIAKEVTVYVVTWAGLNDAMLATAATVAVILARRGLSEVCKEAPPPTAPASA